MSKQHEKAVNRRKEEDKNKFLALKSLTAKLRARVQLTRFQDMCANALLLLHYKGRLAREINAYKANTDLRSYEAWRKEGRQVRKGEKGLPIWGKPVSRTQKESETEEDEMFYPIAYVFDIRQTDPVTLAETAKTTSVILN